MKGIDPPTPMSTGSVPSHASVKAARAASYAGPVASIDVASPVSTTVNGSRRPTARAPPGAPSGGRSRSRSCRPARCASRSWRGPTGTRVLRAPATCRRVDPGDGQRRLGPEPRHQPTRCRSSGRRSVAPDSARSRSSGYVDVRGRAADQPLDGHVAGVVVQRGQQPAQRHQGVRHQPAPHARVHGVAERTDLDVGPHQSAQAGGQRRYADVPVAGVGDDDHVGPQAFLVLLEQRGAGSPTRPPPHPR